MTPRRSVPIAMLVGLVVGSCFVSGCAPTLSIFSGPLTVRIVGADDMNGGNAARVYVYELAGDTNFRNTTLSTFWSGQEEALGNELVGTPRQQELWPGETQTLEFEVAEDTQYIGVAANLRSPDGERWRSIHAVEDVKGEEIVVRVGAGRVDVNVQ
ncbi:MAG: type VI secretion system lipoprotein TssJ [Bacteroidetes bacterium]|nr:type VI secretion system lipoprotein TssJ [Bacteroidota bacterium]